MYSKRLINKKIEHFSMNEIFEIIEYSNDLQIIKSAKLELKKRNLNEDKFILAKNDYKSYKKLLENRKNEVLTISEWFSFFFVFMKMRTYFSPNDDFSDSELERFVVYGFETKYEQAIYAKKFGIVFFYVITPLCIFVIINWSDLNFNS